MMRSVPQRILPGLKGQGGPGIGGGQAGDLYLEVHFKPTLRYRVEDRDVYVALRVTP